MTIRAKLFIQGGGNCLVHDDQDQLLVLLPRQEQYAQHRSGNLPATLCRHFPMVQMDGRHLTGEGAVEGTAPWTTFHLDGHWVGFDFGGSPTSMSFPESKVPGIPHLDDLVQDATYNPRAIPTGPSSPPDSDLVSAALYLDAGSVQPFADFEHRSQLVPANTAQQTAPATGSLFSTVLEVDFGEVESAALLLRPFDRRAETTRIELQPVSGRHGQTIDVWFRHFCQLTRPVRCTKKATSQGRVDHDFLLNYLLLQNPAQALQNPMIPVLVDGVEDRRGVDCVQCQCSGGTGGRYAAPSFS